ncbi:MAG: hypothetical protein ACYTFG_19895, partial [Planctomycetota bacterium]
MSRDAFYEDEYYSYGSRTGIQDYLNESLRQAPWWLISVAAHGVLAVALTLAHFTEYEKDEALVVETAIEQDEQEDPMDEKLEREVFERDEEITTDDPPIEDPVLKDAEDSDHNETDSNEDYESSKGVDAMSDKPFQGKYWNSAIGYGGGAGGCFGDRWGGRRNLKAKGGGAHTEASVLVGLIWLKNHQNPDGMWSCNKFMMNCKKGTCNGAGASSDYDTGVTGMALLAFLGAGHTHKRGKFKHVVKKAVRALK